MKFELDLDEAEANAIVYDLRGAGSDLEKAIAQQIAQQIPIPAPTKIGAVVRTTGGVAILSDPGSSSPWVLQMGGDYTWADMERIGRITEVLSEGVDL